MINVTFMGNVISVNETVISNCAVENSMSLEQCLKTHFNPYAQNGENFKRELLATLGRQPTTAEIEACLNYVVV